MFSAKTLKAIEYDKILSQLSDCAVLSSTKNEILSFNPVSDLSEAEFLLRKTKEAYSLLYKYNLNGVYYCADVSEYLKRVDLGGTLINGELIRVAEHLKSARIIKSAIESVNDENIVITRDIAKNIFTNIEFEKEISSKIISEDEISDNASPKLYSIRKSIRNINTKIREQLNSYIRGNTSKYLQDGVVTMRRDRYVIPVKSEYRSFIKGFIHDQSSSGATVFIEPEHVMELNNQLKSAMFDEANEIRRILAELSSKISFMSDGIRNNDVILTQLDNCFARAIYSFNNKCTEPILNDKGVIKVYNGRHPLINKNKVVPINLAIGEKYNFLLITGPNTGGKTVTLKLTGLFSLMAMSGLFLPAESGTVVSVFNGVFADIGDEQSIENDLSTFSSHIKNLINILDNANEKSLVLLDEIGAGTDPEEGSAIALSIIEKLLEKNCFGIITTHYSKLKEYALGNGKIENASMEFDSKTLKPLYKINIGIPGSSNAIEIASTLGLDKEVIENALSHLSSDKISFEKVLKKAEESRIENEKLRLELQKIIDQKENELSLISIEKDKIIKERERIYNTAKQETKRIVADKLSEAEEIIAELKNILKIAGLECREVIKASELRNRLANSKYLSADIDQAPIELKPVNVQSLKKGNKVFVKSLNSYSIINQIKQNKREVEVLIGNAKSVVLIKDLFNNQEVKKENVKINVSKRTLSNAVIREINILGKTSLEAITEIEKFIDHAVVNGVEEVKIIHGIGEGVLLKTVREFLRKNKNVLEYRRGVYGEGENGVTIVKLK